jgi:hypothetical protein
VPIQARYVLSAPMDVEPGKDAIFNELYSNDHIRLLRQVPGVPVPSACPSRGRRAGRSLRPPDAPRRPLPGGRGRRYSLGASGQAEAGDAGPERRRESTLAFPTFDACHSPSC